MRQWWLMLVLVAASACARADGGLGSDASGTADTPKAGDAAIDSNGCSTQP